MQHGLLEAVPDNLEELLIGLEKHPLPKPQTDWLPAGTGASARSSAMPPGNQNTKTSEQHSTEYSLEGTWKRDNSPRSSRTERVQTIIRPGNPRQEQNTPRRPGWQGLDPRAKWLGMILGSLVLLGMNTLLPLLLTAGLLAGLAASARISWRRAFRFFRPFLLMFLFLWLLAGLSWSSPDFALGPLSFSYEGLMRGELACCASCC